jgi:hypothetical protein
MSADVVTAALLPQVILSTILDAIVQTTKPIGQRLFVAADTEFVARALIRLHRDGSNHQYDLV